MAQHKIFTINPGSTSTKIALFQGDKILFSQNVSHDAAFLAKFNSISEQYIYRKKMIEEIFRKKSYILGGSICFCRKRRRSSSNGRRNL